MKPFSNSNRSSGRHLFLVVLLPMLLAAEPAVIVQQPVRHTTGVLELPVQLQPLGSRDIRAPLSGKLAQVHVKDGQQVEPGDKLFELEAEALQKAVQEREAEVKQREQLVEKAATALKAAGSDGTKKAKLEAQRELEQAELDLARTRLQQARKDLDATTVAAPVKGQIQRLAVKSGAEVVAIPGHATLLCRLVPTYEILANFELDEPSSLRIGESLRAKPDFRTVYLKLQGETDFVRSGTLGRAENQIDPQSGRLRGAGHFVNPDAQLLAAVFREPPAPALIRIPQITSAQVLLIDETAVSNSPDGRRYVLIVNAQNKVEQRFVQIGSLIEGKLSILDGLKPEDWVIVHAEHPTTPEDRTAQDLRLLRLKPGTTVEPVRLGPTPLNADPRLRKGQP